MVDEYVIARASSGLALCGTYVGGSDELIGSKRVSKALLCPPRACKLKAPDRPFRMERLSFFSLQAMEGFRESVSRSGFSVALKVSMLNLGLCGVTASMEFGSSKENRMKATSTQESSETCDLEYSYIPKAAFNLPSNEMQLTEEALGNMRRIRTTYQAQRFLDEYNSHVSTGTYYLGGILLNCSSVKGLSESDSECSAQTLNRNADANAGVRRLVVGEVGAKLSYENALSLTSSRKSDSQQEVSKAFHMALGPATGDREEFEKRLEDRSTWYIIDTSDGGELVPVWEIPSVRNDNSLRQACDLLREAWQITVESATPKSGSVLEMLLKKDRNEEVDRLLDLALNEVKDPVKTDNNLKKLWSASAGTASHPAKWDHTLRVLQKSDFHNLLSEVAASTDENMSQAKDFITHGILSSYMRSRLEQAGILLPASVKDLLKETQSVDRLPTLELKPLRELEAGSSSDPSCEVEEADKACLINQDLSDALSNPTPVSFDPQEADPLDVTIRAYNNLGGSGLTYNGDFLVDRPHRGSCEDLCTRMMDRLRHRMQPFTEILNTSQDDSEIITQSGNSDDDILFGLAPSSCDREAVLGSGPACSNQSPQYSPLAILVQLLTRSDVLARTAIFQVLLEERFAVPLVVPLDQAPPTDEGITEFGHLLEALGPVKVKLAREEMLSVAEDTKLLRVVFVSNREVISQVQTTEMASEVMNCQLPNCGFDIKGDDGSRGPTIMELGVGFVKGEAPPEYVPCLAFCVSGDHNKLGTVLEKIADVVIMETEPDAEQCIRPSWISTRHYTFSWSTDSRRTPRQNTSRGLRQVRGHYKWVSNEMSRFIVALSKKHSTESTTPLDECLKLLPPFGPKTLILKRTVDLDKSSFIGARKDFLLQKFYCDQAYHYFELQENRAEEVALNQKIKDSKEQRAKAAENVWRLPILQHFVKLLSVRDPVNRNLGIAHFQLTIDEELRAKLEEAVRMENDAFADYQNNLESKELKEEYYRVKAEHVDQMLGLEHLWRELSHIFVADPQRKRRLPKLAAFHLLDGFPLEILDGDAALFHQAWVNTVLVELGNTLESMLKRKARVFVLSVVGLQSSGKSTLLNVMFGAKLKTSAGMCTRGVFLQLVKAERQEFDYVLILDTMGLKAPEYFGRKGAVAQDNRLAAFAVLPADACVVMVTNEEDNGLKEVLPMVMLAFKGSVLAEKTLGRIRSKLFFVYRSVDISDVGKLKNNQRKLKTDLHEASKAVGNLKFSGTGDGNPAPADGVNPLDDFHIDLDEKRSDVKYLGNIKKDTKPPGDVPVWEYGSKVEELREYIHERVLSGGRWKAHDLLKWKEYLGMVWESITGANFELSFKNHMQHASYNELQTTLQTNRQKVGKKWQEKFERLTATDRVEPPQADNPSWFLELWGELEGDVKVTVKEVGEEVVKTLKFERFQDWEIEETGAWNSFCLETGVYWREQLRNWIDGVHRFERLLRSYITKMEKEMSSARDKCYNPDSDREKMLAEFDSIFLRVLQDAAVRHPAMATTVETRIHEKYVKHAVVGKKYHFIQGSVREIQNAASVGRGTSWGIFSSNREERGNADLESKVISRLESCLEDVRQYSDHLVDQMIQLTEDILKEGKADKSLGRKMHNLAKVRLTKRMTEIQERWDKQHNVSKMLEDRRGYFWERFENHARNENDTKMLTTVFCNALRKDCLSAAFEKELSKKVADRVQHESWLCNWKVMRAHLDLDLIELIESKETDSLLRSVSEGKAHYHRVLVRLIKDEIGKYLEVKDWWTVFIDSISYAIDTAAREVLCSDPGPERPRIFRQSIIKLLANYYPDLAKIVSINVSEEVCKLSATAVDFYEVRDMVTKRIGDIHLDMDSFISDQMAEVVRRRMVESMTLGAGPRCDEECPRCGLTCFRPSNHSGKHSTLHQPEGLRGVIFASSKQLSWSSCTKSVSRNFSMSGPGWSGFVPYMDFEKYFPTWTLPYDDLETVEVREYVFANFQADLVKRYKKCKVCEDIPSEFQHNLNDLRVKVSNVIRSY